MLNGKGWCSRAFQSLALVPEWKYTHGSENKNLGKANPSSVSCIHWIYLWVITREGRMFSKIVFDNCDGFDFSSALSTNPFS